MPIKIEPLPALEVPTSRVILPAAPAEALPVVITTAPVPVVPVPVEILVAPDTPAEALPVLRVAPPLPPATATVSKVKAVLAVVAPERIIKLEVAPVVDQVEAAPEDNDKAPAKELPIETAPVLVPVLILVSKLELAFKLTAAPVIVRPRAPWIKPAPELTPTAVTAPAWDTEKLVEVIRLVPKVPDKLRPLVMFVPVIFKPSVAVI